MLKMYIEIGGSWDYGQKRNSNCCVIDTFPVLAQNTAGAISML